MNLPKELEELKNYKNWVCYPMIWNPTGHKGRGAYEKPPINPYTLKNASPTNPNTWSDYQTAVSRIGSRTTIQDNNKKNVDCTVCGIGVTLDGLKQCNVNAGDIDSVLNLDGIPEGTSITLEYLEQNKRITPEAADIIRTMNTYTEASASKTGIRLLYRDKNPWPEGMSYKTAVPSLDGKEHGGELDICRSGRYVTITGITILNRPITDCSDKIEEIRKRFWKAPEPEPEPGIQNPAGGKSSSVVLLDNDRWDEWQNYIHFMDDSEILDAILKSGIGYKIRALFDGDTSAYDNDQSRADMALITYLYCFTGDRQRTDSLFRLSGLYRDKWERADYRERAFRWAERNFTPLVGFIEFTAEQRRQYGIEQHRKDNQAFGFDDPVHEPAADPVIAAADSGQIQEPDTDLFFDNPGEYLRQEKAYREQQAAAEPEKDVIQLLREELRACDTFSQRKQIENRIRALLDDNVVNTTMKQPDNVSAYISSGKFIGDLQNFRQYMNRKSGFENLDKITALYPGVYVLGALSSLGKTSFMLQLADNLAADGEHVLYFSMEQTAAELVSKSISRTLYQMKGAETASAINIRRGRYDSGKQIADNPDPYNAAVNEYTALVGEYLHIVETDFRATTVEGIRKQIADFIDGHDGIRPVVIIDYLQILSCENDRLSDKQKVDFILETLKSTQKRYGLTMFLISSFNRTNYLSPVDFESFKESGSIEYTADVCWGLELQVLQDPVFDSGRDTKIKEKRAMVKMAKAATPRKISLVCLKNRYGIASYSCDFDYFPQWDIFVPSAAAAGAWKPKTAAGDGFTKVSGYNPFETKRQKQRELLKTAYEEAKKERAGQPVTTFDLAEKMDISQQAVKRRLREFGGFSVERDGQTIITGEVDTSFSVEIMPEKKEG